MVKNLPASAGDIAAWAWSLHPEDPLEEEMATHSSSCLENLMDRGAWWATVRGVIKESDMTEAICCSCVYMCWKVKIVEGYVKIMINSFQSLNHVQLLVTPWTSACQASLSITNSQNPPKPLSNESVMPSNYLILCRPLLLLPSIFPSIRVFSSESALCIRWPKYWSFSFSISPSNEHPGLISFWMDWLDPLAIQGTLKSLFQHHSSKASILQCSAFFIVQLSHPSVKSW